MPAKVVIRLSDEQCDQLDDLTRIGARHVRAVLKSVPVVGPAARRVNRLRRRYLKWKNDPERLLRRHLGGRVGLNVVQIGSNDGKTTDPIYALLNESPSWTALLVEPVPFVFDRLRESYSGNPNALFANLAVSDRAGSSTFYYVDESAMASYYVDESAMASLPVWADQLGSFDPGHIARHLDGQLEPFQTSLEVATVTLEGLLAEYDVELIDVLHIDTEGHDWVILRQFDLTKYRPEVILFEHIHLTHEDKAAAVTFLRGAYKVRNLGCDFYCSRIGSGKKTPRG